MPRAVFRRHSQRRTAPRHPSHHRRAALRHSVLRCVHRPLERPASQAVAAKSLDPGFRLRRPRDDIKNKTSSPPVRPTLDVIPDGAQRPHSVPPRRARRSGPHPGWPVPSLMSSRTARSAEPGSSALRYCAGPDSRVRGDDFKKRAGASGTRDAADTRSEGAQSGDQSGGQAGSSSDGSASRSRSGA